MRKEHTPKAPRKKDDIEFEITFYESILKETPDFIEALTVIGDLYTRAGHWQKGLNVDLRLTELRPDDPVIFYNLACSYALLNQTRVALTALTKAIELGYDDFEYMKTDMDLENLFKDEHFQKYVKSLEKKKKPSKQSNS